MEKEESQLEMQTVETPKTASQRITDLSKDIDFGLPPEQDIDYVMKDYTMNLSPERARDMVRNSGIQSSFGEQVATGVENVVASLSMLPDQASIAYGNLTNYFSGGKIGEELQNAAFDSLQKRMTDIGYNEEVIGGVNDWLAQLVTGGASFMELALVSMATGGVGGLAQIVTQEMGEGFYNDMQAYLDTHGSLDGYKPKGSDVALNIANTILQAGIEAYLGVGSPRFLTGWSRGLWKEGLSGFGQEFAQGALSDFNEFLKGNTEAQDLMEQADQWVRDGIVGGVLQGTLGAVTYGTARRKHDMLVARAHAMSKGRKEPNKEDMDIAKKLGDLKEQGYGSAFAEEFKKRFDATSPVGQLQQKIATAINDAYKAGKIDFGGASETQIAQKIESFAAQETLNAMEDSAERNQSIGEHELNSIVFKGAEGAKEGELWLAGLEPEVGERSVDLAKVLEYRQSGLAEINAKLDELNSEVKQTQAELKEATAQKKAERIELLQARIEKTNAQIEKQRLQKERVEASAERIKNQIAKMSAPKAEKASEQKSLKAEREQEKAVKEQRKQAREKKPATAKKEETKLKTTPTVVSNGTVSFKVNLIDEQQDEFLHQDVTEQQIGETIVVDGIERPTKNSNGDLIGNTVESLTNFWKWFGDSKVVDKDGRPLVVYHGSTKKFEIFDINKSSKESNLGAGFYFTNNIDDLTSNYEGGGADFDNRIDRIAQRIEQEEGVSWEEAKEKAYNQEFEGEFRYATYLKLEKPFIIGGTNETVLTYEEKYNEETDEYEEPTGSLIDFAYRFDNELADLGIDDYTFSSTLFERAMNNGGYITATEIDELLSGDEQLGDMLIDYAEESVGQLLSDVVGYEYDGFIDNTVDKKFGSHRVAGAKMEGVDESTTHYIAFEPNQIKSTENRGTWSADEKNMLKQSRPDQSRLDKGDTYRGAYDEKLKRIILNEKSDLTTLQHEFAHYWIQNNFRWYRSGLASDDWKRNWERVEQALGIEPTDKYLSKVASEKFARAYERYIMEGKVAPEYQWAFAEFQEFYNEVYEDLKAEYFDLNEELSQDLVDWFNRQRPVAPEQVAEMTKKQVYQGVADFATKLDEQPAEEISDGVYTASEPNNEGGVEEEVFVETDKARKSKLAVYRETTSESNIAKRLREKNPNLTADKYANLNRAETVEQAIDWVTRDFDSAWQAFIDPKTNVKDRAALFIALERESANNPQLAIDLLEYRNEATELGQAVSILAERPQISTVEILALEQEALGEATDEQIAKEISDSDVAGAISENRIKQLKELTECVL